MSDLVTRGFEGLVDYERPDTWPLALTALFDAQAKVLEDYAREEHRIMFLNFEARWRARNEYRDQRDRVVRRADEILANERLLGFHCTRLADDEIADIQAHGLRLPSADFLHERIQRRIKAGDIPESLGLRLLNKHQANDENRQGRLGFVNMRSALKSEGGVGRLFRSWGGEALYNSHEDDPETGPLLRRIGAPCIWIIAPPIRQWASIWANVGERFIWAWLERRGGVASNRPDIEFHPTQPVPRDEIIDVVHYENPAFEELTDCSKWHESLVLPS